MADTPANEQDDVTPPPRFDTGPAEVTDLQLTLERFERGGVGSAGYEPVVLITDQGDIETHYYPPARAFCDRPAADVPPPVPGAIFVGGVGGGFDTPVRGWLYPRLSRELAAEGVACLRVRFRHPGDLEQCVLDVLAALAFLDEEGVGPVALVGHSFGGAVVIRAALLSPAVVACVALSTQSYGAEGLEHLGPRSSVLLAHGEDDEVLPAVLSRELYAIASEPKRLLLKEGVRHGLDEWADELPQLLHDWIAAELRRACATWRG
jgi:pimeloyl-ACP methyl ester carboxylesterase